MNQEITWRGGDDLFARWDVATSRAWAIPGFALFFLMLVVPTVYKPIKIVLLLAVVTVIAGMILRRDGRIGIHGSIVAWTWFLTCIGLFFALRGVVRGHPGSVSNLTIFVLWPWLYLYFIAGASKQWMMRSLLLVMFVAIIAIEFLSVQYVLYELGLWPDWLYLQLNMDQAIGFYDGFLEYRLISLDSLIFLLPWLTAVLLLTPTAESGRGDPFALRIPKWLVWTVWAAGVALCYLSGRRSLMIVVLLAPLFTLVLRRAVGIDNKSDGAGILKALGGIAVAGTVIVMFLQMNYGITIAAIWEMVMAGFDTQYSLSASIRAKQFEELMAAWREQPILGTGFGADIGPYRGGELVGSTKINTASWSYELQYVTLLMNTGIVGFLLYLAGVSWLFWKAIETARRRPGIRHVLAPVLVGTLCFLIATSINPYLLKYDFLWVLFLPLLFVNYCLVED